MVKLHNPMLRGWLLLLWILARTAHAQHHDDATPGYAPTPPVLYPGGVRSLRDVTFAEPLGFRPLTLDLYLPPEGGPKKKLNFRPGWVVCLTACTVWLGLTSW